MQDLQAAGTGTAGRSYPNPPGGIPGEADFLREDVSKHRPLFSFIPIPRVCERISGKGMQRLRLLHHSPAGPGDRPLCHLPQFPNSPSGAGEAALHLVAEKTGWQTRPGKSLPASRRKSSLPFPTQVGKQPHHLSTSLLISPRQGARPQLPL